MYEVNKGVKAHFKNYNLDFAHKLVVDKKITILAFQKK